jgi:membrane protease YdiL (CAAX protease family)
VKSLVGSLQCGLAPDVETTKIGPVMFLWTMALSVLLAVGLGETYAFFIGKLAVAPWIAILVAHTVLALLLIKMRKPVREGLRLRGGPLLPWLAAPLVLVGAYLLGIITKSDGVKYSFAASSDLIYAVATLTVIPLVEEIIFRGGVSPFLTRFVGGPWAVWFAAIVFSVAHSMPTWGRIVGLKVGLPIGPFLLAVCCDFIVRRWGRIWPAVFFHGACNGTVYIFSYVNPSWIRHFSGLYL